MPLTKEQIEKAHKDTQEHALSGRGKPLGDLDWDDPTYLLQTLRKMEKEHQSKSSQKKPEVVKQWWWLAVLAGCAISIAVAVVYSLVVRPELDRRRQAACIKSQRDAAALVFCFNQYPIR